MYIEGLAISPEDDMILSSSGDTTEIWNVENGEMIRSMEFGARKFVFSEDGSIVATRLGGLVKIWSINDSHNVWTLHAPEGSGKFTGSSDALALSKNGKIIAVGNDLYGPVYIWSTETKELIQEIWTKSTISQTTTGKVAAPTWLSRGPDYVSGLDINAGGDMIAIATSTGIVEQWQMVSGVFDSLYKVSGDKVIYSPKENTFSSWEYSVQIWDADNPILINTLDNYITMVYDIAFSPDGSALVIGTFGGEIWQRRVSDGAIIRNIPGHTGTVFDVEYSQDGKYIISGSTDSTVRLWDVNNGTSDILVKSPYGWIERVSVSSDSKYVGYYNSEEGVSIVRVSDGTLLKFIPGNIISFSPVDSLFVAGTRDDPILYTLPGLTEKFNLNISGAWDNIVFSYDGSLIAAYHNTQGVTVREVADGLLVRKIRRDDEYYKGVTISPNNDIVAVAYNNVVELYRLGDGKLLHEISIPTGWVKIIAFSPDGHYLAVGNYDGTVTLWGIAP